MFSRPVALKKSWSFWFHNQWKALFRRGFNWAEFTVIQIEFEHERMLANYNWTFALLGFRTGGSYCYGSTEVTEGLTEDLFKLETGTLKTKRLCHITIPSEVGDETHDKLLVWFDTFCDLVAGRAIKDEYMLVRGNDVLDAFNAWVNPKPKAKEPKDEDDTEADDDSD